jgi:hypothetical protein
MNSSVGLASWHVQMMSDCFFGGVVNYEDTQEYKVAYVLRSRKKRQGGTKTCLTRLKGNLLKAFVMSNTTCWEQVPAKCYNVRRDFRRVKKSWAHSSTYTLYEYEIYLKRLYVALFPFDGVFVKPKQYVNANPNLDSISLR